MSNKFEIGINRTNALNLLTSALGADATQKLALEFGDIGLDTLIDNIATAYSYYPMFNQIAKIKDEQELANLLTKAAQKQAEIRQNYFDKTALTELGNQLYQGTYEFVLRTPELKQIFKNWKTATSEEQKKLCTAVIKNISQQFGVPEPQLLFQTQKTLPVNGMSLPNAIVINLANQDGILGLLTHEFTHHLQHHGKTPGAKWTEKARKYYIFSSMLSGKACAKFREFIDNNIYRASLIEAEAIFTGQYVKDMYRKLHMSEQQNTVTDKSRDRD